MKIDSVHAEFMSGNAVSSTTSSHSIVARDASGDIEVAGVTIVGNSGTLFSYSDGTRSVYGGCNASDPWFGANSNHDLRLVTNSNERMRIDKNGNVGIGTGSPGTYLHLYANNSDVGATEGDLIGTHNLTEYLRFTSKGDSGDVNSVCVGLKLGADDNSAVSPDGRLDICANDGAVAGNIYGTTPDKTIATFIGSGNVGIGTTGPFEKLDVRGAIIAPVVSYAGDQDAPYLIASSPNYTGLTTNWGTHGIQHRIKTDSGGTPRITVDDGNGSEVFTIKNGGNIGIGTANPGIILDVGSSLTNPQIGRDYAVGSVHDTDKRDSIYFGRWDGNGRDFLGMKCRVDTHSNLGYGDYSNQSKIEFYTWGNNYASSREVMCIRGDGNVGIGTASPAKLLHLHESDGEGVHRTLLWSSTRSDDTKPQLGYLGTANGAYASGAIGLFKNTVLGGTEDETVRIQANGNSWLNGGWCGVGTYTPKTLTHIGKLSANSGTHNTIPSSNMGVATNFPDSTHLWLGNHSSAESEDYWGMAMGTLYSGQSYIQNVNKSVNDPAIYYDLLLQPNGGKVGIGMLNPGYTLQVNGTSNFNNEMTWSLGSAPIVSHAGWGSNADWYIRSGSTSGQVILQDTGGNVGINNSSPSYKLDVSGDTRMVGKCIVQTNNSSNGVVCTGTNVGSSNWGYIDGNPGVKLRGYDTIVNGATVKVLDLVAAPGGTPRMLTMNLGSDGERWINIYTSKIYRSSESGYSDDRIKTGETLVENATETLLKLKPQTYDKHSFEFDKFTEEEYNNVSSSNTVFSAHSNCWADQTELIENTIHEAEHFPYVRRRLSAKSEKETGLIAQDVWYDAPELRHIVSLPSDATPAEEKPTGSDDPQDDPDYDSAGWGTRSAAISYTQIIPVLVKSNQELDGRLQAEKARNDALESRVTELEGMVSLIRHNMTWPAE